MKYDAKTVARFLDSQTEVDPDTRQRWLNGVLMERKDINAVYRWRNTTASVTIDDIDAFLIRHHMMLWEMETWADDKGLFVRIPCAAEVDDLVEATADMQGPFRVVRKARTSSRTRRLSRTTIQSNSTRP